MAISSESKEILFEFISIGNAVKATAIDPDTGIEASIVLPAGISEPDAQKAALKKLEYVISKHSNNPKSKI